MAKTTGPDKSGLRSLDNILLGRGHIEWPSVLQDKRKLVSKEGDVFKLVVQFEKQPLTKPHSVRS